MGVKDMVVRETAQFDEDGNLVVHQTVVSIDPNCTTTFSLGPTSDPPPPGAIVVQASTTRVEPTLLQPFPMTKQ